MKKPIIRIAHYRSERGAQRYADELAKAFPDKRFIVGNHPNYFGFSVKTCQPCGVFLAWAGARPKGGPKSIGGRVLA